MSIAINNLIAQIKSMPNTQVNVNLADNGLGCAKIYETTPKGVKTTSIWIGRPFTGQSLRKYISLRQA